MALENIEIPVGNVKTKEEELNLEAEMTMAVSPVCQKDGKQYAFVTFTAPDKAQVKSAEGKIPDCTVIANNGFTEDEVQQLERYMKRELTRLKKMASSVNVLEAFMK